MHAHGFRGCVSGSQPVRVRFAGGWSDTPPYTLDHGGAVLNAAVQLDGQRPLFVSIDISDRGSDEDEWSAPVIVGAADATTEWRSEWSTTEDLFGERGSDDFAIHRAVLLFFFGLACSAAPDEPTPLAGLVDAIFGPHSCLTLRTSSLVPQGSGLGASSILILAALRGLDVAVGVTDRPPADEINAVLAIEQLDPLASFGGWQDAAAAATCPGLKLVQGSPGIPPKYSFTSVPMSSAHRFHLEDRLLVVFSGVRRVASVRLGSIMDRYRVGDEEATALLGELAQLAHSQLDIVRDYAAQPIDGTEEALAALGKTMMRTQEIDDALDESSTGRELFDALCEHAHGVNFLGSGAGGCLLVLLRAEHDVHTMLQTRFADARAMHVTFDFGEE